MINYPYPTLFLTEGTQKDLLITDGTVTVVGTTYTVSDETVLIDNSVLESEAFELYQSINSEMQIEFGSCDTGSIRFTIRKSDDSNIIGTVLKVYLIPNHDASKMLQLGVFKVSEDVRSQDHLKHTIVANDAMYDIINADVSSWYNTILPDDNTTVTLSAFRTSFLANFNITAEAVTLINDSTPIRRTLKIVKDDNAPGHESLKSVSGAVIIKSICQINAVFGTITNEGKFRYVSLVDPISSPQDTIEIPVSYCVDVNTGEEFYPFRAIKVKTSKRTQTKAWGVIIGGRNTYKVTNNPLIDDYSEDELDDLVNALFTATDGHAYTPFTLTAIGNPLHEVGDPIKVYKPDGTFFYSYIFERRMTGIQSLRDTYSANSGEGYWEENLNSQLSQINEIKNKEYDVFSVSQNGLVPKPSASDVVNKSFLCANGTWITETPQEPTNILGDISYYIPFRYQNGTAYRVGRLIFLNLILHASSSAGGSSYVMRISNYDYELSIAASYALLNNYGRMVTILILQDGHDITFQIDYNDTFSRNTEYPSLIGVLVVG